VTRVVDEARAWLGTPYVHQASCKGAGCDCLGLLRGIWRAHLGEEPRAIPAYTQDWSEASGEERLWAAARELLLTKNVGDAAQGDVLLFRMRASGVAKHVGIQAETGAHPTFIHAYSGRGVVENSLTPPWERRLVARFAFPERTN
jgi:NlpC/P60 family putative phage cell wall peptidase